MPRVPDNPNNRSVAAILLREGGVIAYPTDTVYGLGAVVFNRAAVSTVFVIKGRDRTQGLPILIASESQLREVAANVSDVALALAKRFWPGPLTLVLPKSEELPDRVTGGRDTVAVRMPDHPVALDIIRRLDRPITGTSANRSGQQDLLDYNAVRLDLGEDVDYIVEAGPSPKGTPSTVIDLTTNFPKLLRQGALTMNDILGEIG